METITENRGAPLPSAKKVVSAPLTKAPSENKNISVETSFRNRQAGHQPCLSFLPVPGTEVLRFQKETSAYTEAFQNKFLQSSAEQFRKSLKYATWSEIRMKASIIVEMIYRYDPALNRDDEKYLHETLKSIIRAEAAS